MTIRIGIDFDNTIVNYQGLFSAVAKKLKFNLDKYPAKKDLIKKDLTNLNTKLVFSLIFRIELNK